VADTDPVIVISTSLGDITVQLDSQAAPISVENFLAYVRDGFYDGTVFHRVIKDFMVQGGGLTPSLAQKPAKPPIKNEAANGLRNQRGTLAMARTGIIDSATSQFFINVVDNPFLDHRSSDPAGYGYAVFGRVVEGMDTVDAIRAVETGTSGPYQDVPREPVVIHSVREVHEP
jgi:cyclophilin family peptidyl-prolyl cis-trans isomerase